MTFLYLQKVKKRQQNAGAFYMGQSIDDTQGHKTATTYTSPSGVSRHYSEDDHKTGTTYGITAGTRTTYSNAPRTSASSSSQADDAAGCLVAIAVFIAVIFLIT